MTRKAAVKSARRAEPAAAQGERPFEIRTLWATLSYFGLSLLYFLPALLPGRDIFGSDYTQRGYFMYEFARQQLRSGELPQWVPYILGGLPMYANPGGVYYPVRVLADFLLPSGAILSTIFVVQFALAGVGMYLLTRDLGCRTWVAFIGGLAFQFTGLAMSYVHAGHDGRIIVATLAPLVFFFLQRGIRTGSFGAFVGVAATLGATLLSFQIQSNYYLLLAGAAWALFCIFHFGVWRHPRALTRRVLLGLGAVAFAFALSAVNFLPFREYMPDSARGVARGYDYAITWSLPPVEALGVAVPEHSGLLDDYHGKNPFKLNTEYVGALVLALVVLGAGLLRRKREWWFFVGLSLFTLSMALGGYTPLYRAYYALLPGVSRFRAPSIALFLLSLSLAAMATLALERMAQLQEQREERDARLLGRLLPGVFGALLLGIALVPAIAGPDSPSAAGMTRFGIFGVGVCLALWFWWQRVLPTRAAAALIALLGVADLVVIDRKFFSTVDGPDVMYAPDPLITTLVSAPQPNRTWIMPSEDGTEANVLMRFEVEQAGGEHGNQLQRYNEYAGEGKNILIDWHNMLRHSNFVNAANIRYLVTRADLQLKGDDTLTIHQLHEGGGWVYENRKALPRTWLVGSVTATADTMAALTILADSTFDVSRRAVVYGSDPRLPNTPLQGKAQLVEHKPDRVVVRTEANQPALLVLADNWYRDWTATVNGKPAPILRTNHTFRGVPVGACRSEVVFRFHSNALYTGFYLYLTCLALLLGYAVWLLAARLRGRRPGAARV